MADPQLVKAWREWEEKDSKSFRKFKRWEQHSRDKYMESKEKEFSNLIDSNGDIDSLSFRQLNDMWALERHLYDDDQD